MRNNTPRAATETRADPEGHVAMPCDASPAPTAISTIARTKVTLAQTDVGTEPSAVPVQHVMRQASQQATLSESSSAMFPVFWLLRHDLACNINAEQPPLAGENRSAKCSATD